MIHDQECGLPCSTEGCEGECGYIDIHNDSQACFCLKCMEANRKAKDMKPFWKLPLYTSDAQLADYVCIPKFTTMPSVIIWGSRVFVRDIDRGGKYFEAFTVHAMSADNHPQVRQDAMDSEWKSIA